MKELSVEEKAKRYDEAIKKAESLYKAAEPMSGCNVIIETLFPELKESEDEKIRKELISLITWSTSYSASGVTKEDADSLIAWLEKQGKQKNEINLPFGAKDSEFLGANYCIPEGFHAEIKGNRVFIKKGEQKPAWSEEEKEAINSSIAHFKRELADVKTGKILCEKYAKHIKTLKLLRPQSHWKPSDEQMEALADALSFAKNCGEEYSFDLRTLYEQLEKMKQ